MLIGFQVTNHESFRDQASVSFAATSFKEVRNTLIPCEYTKHGLLPVLALYGANASGKSNLLGALRFFQRSVDSSFKRGDANSGLPHKPFMLDEKSKSSRSTYAVDCVIDGTRYQYGFAQDNTRYLEEWLFAFPKAAKQVLFHRNAFEKKEFFFGRGLKGNHRQVESITRPNALFLSVAAQAAHEGLAKIADYFKERLVFKLSPDTASPFILAGSLQDDHLRSRVIGYLGIADTGISDIRIERKTVSEDTRQRMSELSQAMTKLMGPEIPSIDLSDFDLDLQLGHKSSDGLTRYLQFHQESQGTHYLLTILGPLLSALETGSVLVLDETTTSLHTLLSRKLLGLFLNRGINQHGAQLIFSTHDTNLLSGGFLRRDAIWFCEKGEDGASYAFPLSDIKTKNTDNIERGYLQGRFGAIPFIDETGPAC